MTPFISNLTCDVGVTFGPVKYMMKDSTGGALDLTGYSARANVRKTPDGPLEIDLEPEVTDEATGEVTITMTDEETAALRQRGLYYWDLLLDHPDGSVIGPVVAGTFTVRKPNTGA